MKLTEQHPSEARRRHNEAIVARHVRQPFQRLPMLRLPVALDLKVSEPSVCTWPGYTVGRDLHDRVTESLVQLAEECPDAVRLIRGRTFAGAVH